MRQLVETFQQDASQRGQMEVGVLRQVGTMRQAAGQNDVRLQRTVATLWTVDKNAGLVRPKVQGLENLGSDLLRWPPLKLSAWVGAVDDALPAEVEEVHPVAMEEEVGRPLRGSMEALSAVAMMKLQVDD